MEERENENEIIGSQLSIVDGCLYDVCRSICKIIASNKKGSGFLIKL